MDISKSQNPSLHIVLNGIIGFACAAVLFLPVTDWSLQYWQKIYPVWSNIDDLMGIFFCGPMTAVVGALFGVIGGYIGFKIGHSSVAEILGSFVGGILIGMLLPSFMTFNIVQGWTPK